MTESTSTTSTQRRVRPAVLVILLAVAAVAIPVALAQFPSLNGAGASLVRMTSEAWSYGEQTNDAGARVQVTTLGDTGLQSTNDAGANTSVGQFQSDIHRNATGASWRMYTAE